MVSGRSRLLGIVVAILLQESKLKYDREFVTKI